MLITERKQTVLNEILQAFETYKGMTKSKLEETISKLYEDRRLTEFEVQTLYSAVDTYRQHILKALANSERVRVHFGQQSRQEEEKNYPLQDLDKLWKPLDPLDIT